MKLRANFSSRMNVIIYLDKYKQINIIKILSLHEVPFNRFENGICHLAKGMSQMFSFFVQRTYWIKINNRKWHEAARTTYEEGFVDPVMQEPKDPSKQTSIRPVWSYGKTYHSRQKQAKSQQHQHTRKYGTAKTEIVSASSGSEWEERQAEGSFISRYC